MASSHRDKSHKSILSWKAALLLTSATLLVGLLACYLNHSLSIRSARTQKWRIGYQQTGPFISRGSDGNPIGFGRDVLTEAARRARIELEWVFIPNSDSEAFRTGNI